ncbi:MAG: hypothetical protein ABII90_15400, partial [Bacteroidota bacterium]
MFASHNYRKIFAVLCVGWAVAIIFISEYEIYNVLNIYPPKVFGYIVKIFLKFNLNLILYLTKHLWTTFIAVLFMFSAHYIGSLILNKEKKISFSIPLALGLAVFSYTAFLLAVFNLAYPIVFKILFTIISICAIYQFIKEGKYKQIKFDLTLVSVVPIILFGLVGFLITSLPEIFYDSLVYHLGIPKTYLIEHSLGFLKYNFFQTLTGIC